MNESKRRFLDQLLAADPPSAGARQRYEKEMRAMFEKTLTRGERWGYLVGAVWMGALALGMGAMALGFSMRPREGLEFTLGYLPLTALALLVVAGLLFRGYWKGVVNRRTFNDWAAVAGIAYVGLVGGLSLWMASSLPEIPGDAVRVAGLVLLVYAAVAWMRHTVAQAEARTAEKLLEIELRLAEIGEALQCRPSTDAPGSTQPPPP